MTNGILNAKFKTLQKFDTEFPADTVEWCPIEGFREYFACGTYDLEKENIDTSSLPCKRKGTILLLKFNQELQKFNEIFRLQTAAILDMKWQPIAENSANTVTATLSVKKPILATANALGEIDIYTLESERLEHRASIECNADCHNLLALSLDWNWPSVQTGVGVDADADGGEQRQIIVSDSKGDLTLLKCTPIEEEEQSSFKLEKLKNWQAHNFEAWICTFDKWNSNLVYTGGDDLMLHGFDLRSFQRTLTNRSHAAGVTSMLSHPKREHLLLTGSYDERVRLFDTRSMRNPLGELNLQGGIWRLKADPYNGDVILAACMYKNFSVMRLPTLDAATNNPQLLGTYNEHESICYGADWCLNVDNAHSHDEKKWNLYMATCSFYDNKLCVSRVEI